MVVLFVFDIVSDRICTYPTVISFYSGYHANEVTLIEGSFHGL